MLVTAAANFLRERMKDGGFNALELAGKRRLGHIEQTCEFGQVDASGHVPVALTRRHFKHLSLTRCEQAASCTSCGEKTVWNLVASESIHQRSHGVSASLHGPLHPTVTNFKRRSGHHTEVNQWTKKPSSAR